MAGTRYRFDRFVLDTAERRLTRDGSTIDVSGRYFDALVLLAGSPGSLVTKDRFLTEVWRGIPVTDEALTQCVRTLRRALGDDATAPRFIETVPRHGYRFVAAVTMEADAAPPISLGIADDLTVLLTLAGAAGGAAAGAIGGVIYGFTFDAQPTRPGIGAASVLLVLLVVCAVVGAIGGTGVGGGIAIARRVSERTWRWAAVGGSLGGLVVGAIVKLLGTDAFDLLIGRGPGDITGAVEGLVLGAAVGLGGWLGSFRASIADRIGIAAATGGLAGIAIGATGGRLMGGSLDLLARGFSGSRLRMDQIGRMFGEPDYGAVTRIVTTGLEGALFAACVVAAMIRALRNAGHTR